MVIDLPGLAWASTSYPIHTQESRNPAVGLGSRTKRMSQGSGACKNRKRRTRDELNRDLLNEYKRSSDSIASCLLPTTTLSPVSALSLTFLLSNVFQR